MSELVTAADREAAQLRDRLAEIEVEQATLEAELAAFNSDYMRVVMTVMARGAGARGADPRPLAAARAPPTTRTPRRSARARVNETTAHIRAVPRAPGHPDRRHRPIPGGIKRLFRDAAPEWEGGTGWELCDARPAQDIAPKDTKEFGPFTTGVTAGQRYLVLARATCADDPANTDTATFLPCSQQRTLLVDLVANDNNLGTPGSRSPVISGSCKSVPVRRPFGCGTAEHRS